MWMRNLSNFQGDNRLELLTRRSAIGVISAGVGGSLTLPWSISDAFSATKPPFGVAVHLDPFRNEPIFRELLKTHAGLIVPMNALKWASLRHTEGKFDFGGADEIIDFAEANGQPIHGHALLWYHANPSWIDAVTSPQLLERLLNEHIETVVGRYAGRIATWDVVNEVVAHDPLTQGKWRKGVWHDILGPRHVEIAFAAAAKADPNCRLFINDYDLEDDSLRTEARQRAILQIVRRLQKKNIPIHGVGLQAHLYAERRTGRENLIKFVRELKTLGLEVAVTELDVIDWKLSADPVVRDRAVVATVKEFLDAITEAGPVRNITTWGLSDKYSWIKDVFPRDDSATARPLPFDRDWNQKPLFDLIKKYTQ
jgi:endo-1,4-beta-xylanase